jgi:hypothetical protein
MLWAASAVVTLGIATACDLSINGAAVAFELLGNGGFTASCG